MLMSMIWAPRSTLNFAHSARSCGSAPAICTAFGSISPSWSVRRALFSLAHRRGLDAAISDTA
jgi:hypothetical protein